MKKATLLHLTVQYVCMCFCESNAYSTGYKVVCMYVYVFPPCHSVSQEITCHHGNLMIGVEGLMIGEAGSMIGVEGSRLPLVAGNK